MGLCKTWTGYLRMADADGKMRITKKVRGKKQEMRVTKKKNNNKNN